jgi:TatD DNase family protein
MKTRGLVDTHAHLQLEQFRNDLDCVIKRAIEAELRGILVVGLDEQTSNNAVILSQKYEIINASAGLHPGSAQGFSSKRELGWLEQKAYDREIVAIGEIGLDFYKKHASKENQESAFIAQMEIAGKYDLPMIIHARESFRRIDELMTESDGWSLRGVFHCFTGSEIFLQKIIENGFYFSLGGLVTYKNSNSLELATRYFDSLILETDSPFLSPVPFRGKRNEPSYLVHIAETIGAAIGLSGTEVAAQCSERTFKLFGPLGVGDLY